jgi:hypothetical protein
MKWLWINGGFMHKELVIGVQGNIQKRWGDCETMEALCTKSW